MKKRKPSQTRRHRESVREKRRARAFYFARQTVEDSVRRGADRRRKKALADVCGRILVGLAAVWILVYSTIQLTKELMK